MIVGIDLGTTNSLIAYWKDGAAHLIPNSLGETLTPSCVSLDEDGTVLVGRAARQRLQSHPGQSASLFKRHMGSNKEFRLGNRRFRPEELSSLVLRSLKEDAEALIGEPITEAVISVPAYFSDGQRKATRAAAQLAGLHVERLINEPTAAALAYGLHQRDGESQFLVFDLGGGTFDVSLLDMFDGVMEVRSTAGDNFLGGEDFSEAITRWFFDASGIPAKARDDAQFMEHLTAHAEAVKRRLSDESSASLAVEWRGESYALELSDGRYQELVDPLMARLRAPLERTLRDAGVRAADINEVVLAGGATRAPMIRNLVTRMFGRFPSVAFNPDEVVALGAAVMAGLKARDEDLREVVMTDVCPYSLGVEVVQQLSNGGPVDGHFSPIIERNTVIPASRIASYAPTQDRQAALVLKIYQGESRLVRDNIKLGELRIPLERGTKEEGSVDVRFTYDVNGILEVEATRLHTQQMYRLIIRGNEDSLNDEQIAARFAALAELKIHPRDLLENRTLLAEAERVYTFLRDREREQMSYEIREFEAALARQDTRVTAQARTRLREAITYFERVKVFFPETDPS
ncbi:molecular chaperone HscC [Achromobacter deleyi]|uniref:molecular chaperone HscC n=1 Tax=Achromobacter deleyi TaxID=1353891 RepID=UPI001490D7F1|nr:molecular chaperone HscC [Achromobacter deleyi]QVQ24718.1 molecular chaperone HscC [Achromobacter deleyi]UIP20254.1 molecular chaperone HscC [Achromobacter deleyi]